MGLESQVKVESKYKKKQATLPLKMPYIAFEI